MTRIKSAIVVFLGLVIDFGAVYFIDYTDTYVADRFHAAVAEEQYELGEPFSLDVFLQFYDWNEVCVVLPQSELEFSTRLGLPYFHAVRDESTWSLVFTKEGYVVAEIPLERAVIEHPLDLDQTCFDRWSGIISLDENESATPARLRLSFVGG